MMENRALVSLEGNTAQRDLGSCFILKAGFFFIKWINLALLAASHSEPFGRVGKFYPVFPALCDPGAWQHPSHQGQGWVPREGKGSSPCSGQELQHCTSPLCLGTPKFHDCL